MGTIKRNTELTANEQHAVSEEKTAYYENSANDFVVQVPKNIGNNMPVAITYKDHALRFCFNDIAEVPSNISQPKNANVVAEELQKELSKTSNDALRAKIQNEYATAVQNNRSSVSYSAIKTDTDLTYYISGQSLKEDIILHSIPVEKSYSFDFMFNGLKAVLQEDNSVIFYDNYNSPIFVIAAPVMFDSDEGYCADIIVVVEETQTGCRYTLEPNREWLEDESRVYPVTLDPQVTTTQNTNYIHDNGVQQSNPSTNYIAADRMYVGSGSGSYEGRIYFKLTQWPSATNLNANTITSAEMRLSYYPQANWQTAHNMTVDVYRVSSAWNTNTITWNNQTGIGGTWIAKKDIGDARNKTSGYDSFDVTSWVKAHYSSPSTDYGIRLQPRTVVSSTNRACYISSDYYADTGKRPIIRIFYLPYETTLLALKEFDENGNIILRNDYFETVKSYAIEDRLDNCYTDFYSTYTKTNMKNKLQSSTLFFIHTHGKQTGFYCGNDFLEMADLNNVNLSNLKFALLLTCNTGDGGYSSANVSNNTPVNIVEKMVCCGAKTVVGFNIVTYVSDCNTFAKDFARRTIHNGQSVRNAIANMNRQDYIKDMISAAVIGGNQYQTLN